MLLKTKIFEFCNEDYKNLSELAQAMGISVSQIYRVKEGKRNINQKFITGAIKAFPKHKFDDLFYFVPELPPSNTAKPTVTNRHMVQQNAVQDLGGHKGKQPKAN